jgi:hypothetical protein
MAADYTLRLTFSRIVGRERTTCATLFRERAMIAFGHPFRLLRSLVRPLILINAFYFGLVGVGMAYAAWDRETHDEVISSLKEQAPKSLPGVFRAYREGNVVAAIALTFAINLFAGSALFITLPSMIVPFSGLLLGAVRAVTWGLIFSPVSEVTGSGLTQGLLIGLLLLLEGEGYVLAMLAAYVHGRSFLFRGTAGAATRWQGYKTGLAHSAQLYVFVAGTLAIAAVYEAVLAILILPVLK